ncbi:thioredoxin domain-containing protein 16-like [Ptychodera flava]|uniref:thioredoxin domain-containing protein 16-like n=1 Tax=Ptychodera flava TaxID=63121 RepID=UPI003969FB78
MAAYTKASVSLILALAIVGTVCTSTAAVDDLFNSLTVQEFKDFKKSPFVRVVYFYKKDVPALTRFLNNFKVASDMLNDYGVRIATVNCLQESVKEFCEREHQVENNVIVFKYGNVMTEMGLDSMFNVDAIMSNLLQMVLLSDVPIIQSKDELDTMMQRSRGAKDILFSYQKAVGTYEHRIFLEVAFVYGQQYKFAFTTTPEIVSVISSTEVRTPAIWYLQCKISTNDQPCPALRYTGPMNLATYSRYMKLISIPNVIDAPPPEMTTHFQDLKMHQTYIFTEMSSHEATKQLISEISLEYIGLMGFIIMDIEKTKGEILQSLGFDVQERKLPSLAIQPFGDPQLQFMDIEFTRTNIKNFVDAILESLITSEEEGDQHDGGEHFGDEDDVFEVPAEEIQDDPIAEDAYGIRYKKVDMESIPSLTDKSFTTTLTEKPCVLVMFYVPWNAVTQVFMDSYSMAGNMLTMQSSDQTTPLAKVECSEWPDVCAENNVTRYPSFLLFKDGKLVDEYTGRLETQSIVKYMALHMGSNPVIMTTREEADSFTTGTFFPNLEVGLQTAVLGLFDNEETSGSEAFRAAGAQLQGKFILGISQGSVAKEVAQKFDTVVPSVVVVKFNDEHQPYVVSQQDFTAENIVDFIHRASLPVYTELTSSNYIEYQSLHKPFLILFGVTEDISGKAGTAMAVIAKSGEFQDVIFCYMDIEAERSMGAYILHTYTSDPSLPALVLVNHNQGKLYNYPHPYDMSESGIRKWLKQIQQGNVITHTSELLDGKWKPMMAGYDFLSFIDSERGLDDDSNGMSNGDQEMIHGGRFPRAAGTTTPSPKAENEGVHSPVHTEL